MFDDVGVCVCVDDIYDCKFIEAIFFITRLDVVVAFVVK